MTTKVANGRGTSAALPKATIGTRERLGNLAASSWTGVFATDNERNIDMLTDETFQTIDNLANNFNHQIGYLLGVGDLGIYKTYHPIPRFRP